MIRCPVLVTGVGGPAGRAVSALLAARGLEVRGVDMTPVELPGVATALVPPATDGAFTDELAGLASAWGVGLVIPTVSEELPILAGCAEVGGVPVAIAAPEAVRIAADKWLTCRALEAAGVAVPRFALPAQAIRSAALADALGSPCLRKPRVGRGARGVTLHESPPAGPDAGWILQEFAPGTEYAPALFVGTGAEPDVVAVLEKTGLAHGKTGNAVGVRRVAAPDIGELALAAAHTVGLTGAVDVDIRRRADGTPVVLELNARFGANATHAPEVLDAVLAAAAEPATRAA